MQVSILHSWPVIIYRLLLNIHTTKIVKQDQVEMLRIKISNICIIVIVVQFSHSNGVVVPTKYGNVRGLQTDDGYAFLGIPYAAPPVGNARYNRLYKL